jgi:isopentenyl-diphosphate delta-isomerase
VPVLANLGAQQVRDRPRAEIFEWLRRLEVQALVVHLNPGQELFQPEGDRDFRGLKGAIARLCEHSPVPVIVKETGFGILPSLVRELLDGGAAYVDLAGAGGTNWIRVEAYRLDGPERAAAEEFSDWGLPTAVLLGALRGAERVLGRVLASGGLRSGLDAAKAVALGAELAGMALPFIREVCAGGAEAVVGLVRRLELSFRSAMLLTGSRTLPELRRGVLWVEPGFTSAVEALRAADLEARP